VPTTDRWRAVWRSAALTAAAYAIAAAATAGLWDAAFHMFPFTLFFATAAVTAAAGGGRAGVAVAALGTASVAHLANDTGPSTLVPGAVLVGVTAFIGHLACARRRDAAALAAERERLRVILASTADAVVAADAAGAVTFLNAAAERLTGRPAGGAGGAVGRPIGDIVRLEPSAAAADGRDVRLEVGAWVVRLDGTRLPIDASVAPLELGGGAAGSVVVFRDVADRRQSEDRLRRQVERLRLLSDAAGQLLGGASPESTYPALFEQVSARLGLDTYFHYSVDPAGDGLRLESWAGVPDATARAFRRLAFGEAVCGAVAATCRPIVLEDVPHNPDPRAAVLKPLGLRAFACQPLLAGDRLLGTLSFGLRDRDRFDAEELGLLRTVCYYVSAAADRARMLTEAEDRAARLAEGRERLEMALELADLGTWDLDPDAGVMRWCDRCRATFGVPPGAPVGHDTFLARIHAADRERVRSANQSAVGPDGPHEYDIEYRVVRPDGAVRWIAAIGRALPAPGGGRRLIGTVLDVTTRKEHDRRAAVVEERGRMAREIHDTLAQALAGIILHLEAADQAIDHRPDAVRERLAEARALARASLTEARRSVWAFRPQALEGNDLCGALHQLARQSAGRGARVEFVTTGTPAALAADTEDNLLRVAQEALANALRHARAGAIAVELDYTPDGVRLRVRDDGGGFALPDARGFGLVSMRERAQRVGGELTIASRVGAGTEVALVVPAGRGGARGTDR
jgi:PAS domain S-box-containing protein